MKPLTLVFTAGLLASFPFSAHARIERVTEKTFTVTPGGLLKVETQGGDIHVTPGSGNEVKVVAKQHFRANTEEEANEAAKQLSLQIEQSGADVTAVAKFQGNKITSFWRGGGPPVEVEFVVTVPSNYRADLSTAGGNISVGDLSGNVDLRTSGGNITLGKIDGEVEAKTSGGDIQVGEARRNINAHTSGGTVHVGRVSGDAHLTTSGGNIRIDAASGKVDAETSGGDVSARFIETIPADCLLKTSGGNVTVLVNSAAAFKLDASTSGGSVRVKGLTLDVEHGGNGKSSLVGATRGGGPALKLRTSGGDVQVSAD